ncbi:MAG: DUF6471 domain-containing protein [Parvularculaceae bacterium]
MSLTKSKKTKPPKPSARKDDPINAEYEEKAKALVKYAMSQRNVDFEALAEHLASMGISISPGGLANKISRGGFSAAFLLECMEALEINLSPLPR